MSRLPLAPAPSGRATPADLFVQALTHYRQGDPAGARRQLKIVLRKEPHHFDALHLMSLLEAQRGHYKDAERMIRQALRIKPDSPDALSNRGNMLRELADFGEAVACYDAALRLNPKYHNAHNNRAIALGKLGRHDEALQSYAAAIALEPRFAAAYYNRGIALAQLGRYEEAVADYDKSLSIEPGMGNATIDRANALAELGRLDDALTAYRRVLASDARSVPALYNAGLALLRHDRFEEAIAYFDKAVEADPQYASALDARGNALLGLGRAEDALASYDRAVTAAPDFAPAHNNRGLALQRLRRHADAIKSFDAAVRANPDFAAAHGNRAQSLLSIGRLDDARTGFNRAVTLDPSSADLRANRASAAMVTRDFELARDDFAFVQAAAPDYPYIAGNLAHARMQLCDWTGYGEAVAAIESGARAGRRTALPFIMTTLSGEASLHQQAARIWSADMGLGRPAAPRVNGAAREKIRIAYVSADFRDHPIAAQTAQLFALHDRARFDVIGVSYGPGDASSVRARLEAAFDTFIDVAGMDDLAIAALMRSQDIDIAIDLTGYTENCRPEILAARAAPVQVNFLGYPGTLGLSHVDYVIADRHVLPLAEQDIVDERIVHLPDTFFVSDASRAIAQTPTRASAGLPESGFVFCCFNNRYKIAPPMFDIWMRLLRTVDGSVLWLAGGNPVSAENLRREAQERGIAADRLVFANRVPGMAEHLARHRLADLFLDTLPYNAHATATDALWAGLPVLTCKGTAFPGRVAASLLSAIGMPELIAQTRAEYESIARDLARDPEKMASLKATLAAAAQTGALFDTKAFCGHLEAAYITMMERLRRGEKPASFAVPGNG
jgi:predicted O-linked N-acetylglucosamine transferase (SPINDLY family)